MEYKKHILVRTIRLQL